MGKSIIGDVSIDFLKDKNAYLVGGTVRDWLLGCQKETLEIDLAVEKDALKLARLFAKEVNGTFILLDEEHGSARVVITSEKGRQDIDFTDFRGNSLTEDLKKRDFTINAMAVKLEDLYLPDFSENKIIDLCGGRRDLSSGIIRAVWEGAFKDDPLRILRAFSMSARFGFKIEGNTRALIKEAVPLLKNVAAERITDELFKITKIDRSAGYWQEMDELGIIPEIFPEIKPMYDVSQGLYHHLKVWAHSMETLNKGEELLSNKIAEEEGLEEMVRAYLNEPMAGERNRLWVLKLGFLFHDLGKPATFIEEKGKIHFYGHENLGAELITGIGERLKLSVKEVSSLQKMVLYHLRPAQLGDEPKVTPKAILRFFRETGDDLPAIILLSIADKRATCGPLAPDKEGEKDTDKKVMEFLATYFKKTEEPMPPPKLVNGNEIMEALNLPPGPLIGRVLKEIEEAQVEKVIKTKDEALNFARRLIDKEK